MALGIVLAVEPEYTSVKKCSGVEFGNMYNANAKMVFFIPFSHLHDNFEPHG